MSAAAGCAARGLSLSNAPTFGVAVVASADVALEKVRVGLGASRRDPLRSYKNTNALVVAGSRRVSCRVATLESELATERTAKGMLENQLRACVNEVAKILAAKRELEFRLRDVEGDPE